MSDDIIIDRGGLGLLIHIMRAGVVVNGWSSVSDQDGHFSEPIIRALAAEIERLRAELELHRANTREAIVEEVMVATQRVVTAYQEARREQ